MGSKKTTKQKSKKPTYQGYSYGFKVGVVEQVENGQRFRVDEEDKCDPGITSVFGEDVYWCRDLTCYPNPVRDQLTVELQEQKRGQIVVIDMYGQIAMTKDVSDSSLQQNISMGNLQSGAYSVEYIPKKNKERRTWTSKIVKVD